MRFSSSCPTLLLAIVLAGPAFGQEPAPASRVIRAMRYPAVSPDGSRIAFSYRGDLWVVPSGGGEAKRVAEQPGHDTRPRWSPDGQTLAYCSDLYGNLDVFTLPAAGGSPKRITFHTADDVLADWSPDGKSLLFSAARDTRVATLYTIRPEDGRLRQLTRDDQTLQAAQFSPDGQSVAYVRGNAGWARKGYRGSANGELYTLALSPEAQPRRLTQTPISESWPLFSPDGKWLYFTSDADGFGNLWRQPLAGGKPVQVTRQRDGYLHYPALSRDGKTLVYETDFSLWTVDPTVRNPQPRRLTVTASFVDKPRKDARKLTTGATEMELSPDGTQIALGIKGDIYVMPAAGGEARLLTRSLARDYDFSWSPDGRRLVFTSERDANTDLYAVEVATGDTQRLTHDPQPETNAAFSRDGRYLVFLRGANGREMVTMPAGGGPQKVVLSSGFLLSPKWSPDGRWLAYAQRTHAAITNVYVIPAAGGAPINVSRWSGNNFSPAWSPDGERLAFFSTRSGSSEIFTVELQKKAPAAAVAQAESDPSTSNLVSIDAPRIERRVRQLVTQVTGGKGSLIYSPDGKVCLFTASTGPSATAYSVPVSGGSPTKIAEGLGGTIRLSPDGATLYSLSGGAGLIRKVPVSGGTSTPVEYSASIEVDLAEERRETFDQAWRLLRDFFYDPKMHGVDWNAVRARYRPIVDESLALQDFHLLLTEMNGELNASHTGAQYTNTPRVPSETANPGLWFDWSWEGPGLKVADVLRDGPADHDESRIAPGEYVVAVGGKDVSSTEQFWEQLGGAADKPLEILVNSRPQREGARTVKLTPVSRGRFTDLLYEHTVLKNREAVERLSGGKLAYLHIRAMDRPSLERFEREVLTEAYDREGLVLDVRNNPGGRIHDDLFAILTRKVHVFETPRDGLKMTQPFGAFTRPMILLINQSSFSDAEIFSNGFRENGLGKIVGVPTGGGVIGTANLPLLDGQTTFRVPRTGWHTLDGTNLENYGVPPDFRVELLPEHILSGQDPQLETAVRELLKQLAQRKPGKR